MALLHWQTHRGQALATMETNFQLLLVFAIHHQIRIHVQRALELSQLGLQRQTNFHWAMAILLEFAVMLQSGSETARSDQPLSGHDS